MSPQLTTILLLSASNLLMNLAWYGHLKYKAAPLLLVIFVAWGIAFFEYMLMVPANRIGSQVFSLPQLKGIQESLSILTFFIVSVLLFGDGVSMKQLFGFGLMIVAAVLIVSD
ncbi:DMT family protein [Sandaracinobacteroides hominis]|uniref:DMT family protein n=1 Tax=Sandaracinobacteroides hominis TaxID=2780086 RepID=UPI0018F3729E|nr:DMT family protein [Sandaracinobacteroides hominis]